MADGPQVPTDVSVADLIALGKSVWQAFIVPVCLAGWGAFRWLTKNKQDNSKTANEQITTERQHLSGEINAFMDRQSRRIAELEAAETRLDAENKQLTERNVEYRHAANNARQMVNSLERIAGMPLTVWAPWSWTKPENDNG